MASARAEHSSQRVFLYARASSDEQKRKGLSVPAQLKALRQWAAQEGWTIAGEFADDGLSGRTDKRPDFQRMISAACSNARPTDAILVWKFDRYSRDDEDPVVYKNKLRKVGVRVVSFNERFDDSAAGRFGENLSHALAHYFSENLATDIKRGKEGAIQRGFFPGGKSPPGMQVVRVADAHGVPRPKLKPDPLTAPVIAEAFHRYLRGASRQALIAFLKEHIPNKPWHPETLRYLLRNPAYAGAVSIRRKPGQIPLIAWDAHEGIIDRATWERAQQQRQERMPKWTAPRTLDSPYLLTGLIRCAYCDRPVRGFASRQQWHAKKINQTYHKLYRYYWCSGYVVHKKRSCPQAKRRPQEELEKLVLNDVSAVIQNERLVERILASTHKQLTRSASLVQSEEKKRAAQLADLDRRLERLYDALETEALSLQDVAPRIQTLQQQRTMLLQQHPVPTAPPLNMAAMRAALSRLPARLLTGERSERKQAIRTILTEIRLSRENVVLRYRLGNLERIISF